uniref:AN1-type domain-containing protein n=1 Tax=Mesocestoides corti TaxID=53468 RepID=A0A5K3EFL6_MESCO
MEENDQAQAVPHLCRNGCGFYGSPNFDGLCSKCHRDTQVASEVAKPAARILTPSSAVPHPDTSSVASVAKPKSDTKADENSSSSCSLTSSVGTDTGATSVTSTTNEPAPRKCLRCMTCNKRVGLTGFTCRCGGLFCTVHRYSDTHDCAFNYRESGQADIRKANPQVICSKINKI